jgi:putative redox protein
METVFDIILAQDKKVNATIRGFTIATDQPVEDGGHNTAPSPFELFLASLGTCAGYFVLSFCRARAIPTDKIRMTQRVARNDATHALEKIVIDIDLPPDFPEKYKDAVVRAAESCSVKKVIAAAPQILVEAHIRKGA